MGCGPASECTPLEDGVSWTPTVTGASSSNRSADISVSTSVQTQTATVIGYNQAMNTSNDAVFTVNIPDLGPNGSVTFIAEVENYPSSLVGEAEPLLTAVVSPASDGSQDWVNLNMDGGNEDCSVYGLFDCSGSDCELNSRCTPEGTTAFHGSSASDRQDHWIQHQVNSFDYISVNTFPTCDFQANPTECAFNSDFFSSNELPAGTYTINYHLVSLFYQSLSGRTATIRLTTVMKNDPSAVDISDVASAVDNGALDINVVIVGNDNINASRTAKGKQNLNSIFQHVYDHYAQENSGIDIGTINAIEWSCDDDGGHYQDISTDNLGALFLDGSTNRVPASTEGEALNVFFVSSIVADGTASILGVAGGINGPPINGTGASGVVVATFDQLDTYNPDCDGSTDFCDVSDQEENFYDFGATVSHEMGHYLGLNHLTEGNGVDQDFVFDTPECSLASGDSVLEWDGCRQAGMDCLIDCSPYSPSGPFCPAVESCAYNHVMWWRAKFFNETSDTGDGNLFSDQSGTRVNMSPFVR
jgi:hypothetical protein